MGSRPAKSLHRHQFFTGLGKCEAPAITLSPYLHFYQERATFLWMAAAASFDLFLNHPESFFVDPFSGAYGNKFNLSRFFDPVDDSERTDSKTSQPR